MYVFFSVLWKCWWLCKILWGVELPVWDTSSCTTVTLSYLISIGQSLIWTFTAIIKMHLGKCGKNRYGKIIITFMKLYWASNNQLYIIYTMYLNYWLTLMHQLILIRFDMHHPEETYFKILLLIFHKNLFRYAL